MPHGLLLILLIFGGLSIAEAGEPKAPPVPTAAPLQFRMVVDDSALDTEDLPLEGSNAKGGALHIYHVKKDVLLDQTAIASVRLSIDSMGTPALEITMNQAGAQRFAEVTSQNIGKRLAIIVFGKLRTAPLLQSRIPDGKVEISGSFTEQEAKDLTGQIAKSIGQTVEPPPPGSQDANNPALRDYTAAEYEAIKKSREAEGVHYLDRLYTKGELEALIHIGMSEGEVEKLFGKPWAAHSEGMPHEWAYMLAPEKQPLNPTPHVDGFMVEFRDGKITEWHLTHSETARQRASAQTK